MYADRKGWPLDAVEVRLQHEKVHCDDCAGVDAPGGRIDRFTREITLEGALDEEQRQRMLQIADRCPVHRTLEKPAQVTTTLTRLRSEEFGFRNFGISDFEFSTQVPPT